MFKKKLTTILVLAIGLSLTSMTFSMLNGILDITELFNYSDPNIPTFITGNNTPADNRLTDEIATLGRVLFYDKQLSLNATVSCASCHKQEFAFGDSSIVSKGFDGQLTERHSPRLMNMSYNEVDSIFWDHKAGSLEEQPLITLANSVEMGFSGQNGQPRLDSLINRLNQISYYKTLFDFAYGDDLVTEDKVSKALSQFVRSIVSFDSKYDVGRAMAGNDFADFPNFTDQENMGKSLFISPFPQIVSPFEEDPEPRMFFGCANCHLQPTFSQAQGFRGNNGVLGVAGDTSLIDISVVRSPTIRNVIQPDGDENGPFMHDGSLEDLKAVLQHYTFVPYNPANVNLSIGIGGTILDFDHRRPMSDEQADALVAFMGTLTGTDIYENPKWSNPFDVNDQITIKEVACTGNAVATTINASHCQGDTSFGYSLEGTYEDTFIGSNGCDSVRTLILSVHPVSEQDIAMEICEGEAYQGFTQNGTYLQTLQSINGCDSIINLTLTVNEEYEELRAITICEGQSYEGFDSEGRYQQDFLTINGCDSIITINLEVLPTLYDTSFIEICEGEAYEGYTTSGIYTSEHFSALGCDSLFTLELTVLPESDPKCEPTSTSEDQNTTALLYPNPVENRLNILFESETDYLIEIYSNRGQFIESMTTLQQNTVIDMSSYNPGLYLVRIRNQKTVHISLQKIIKI